MKAAALKQYKSNKLKDNTERPPRKKRSFSLEKRRAVAGYMFVLPWIIGFILFMSYPLIMSLVYSFNDVTIEAGKVTFEYVGWGNYQGIFVKDREFLPKFWETIKKTVLWTPFSVVFSMFVAILLNKKIKFRGIFRLIYFLPVLLGTGLVFSTINTNLTEGAFLNPPRALVRTILYLYDALDYDTVSKLIGQILNEFWKTGIQIVIFLAGLQGIPDTLYEAAKVDNASPWQTFWKVTIPMLSPVILLNTIYTIIATFRDETNPLVAYIVDAFKRARYSETTAMSWLYFVVTFIFIGLIFLIMRRSVYYEK